VAIEISTLKQPDTKGSKVVQFHGRIFDLISPVGVRLSRRRIFLQTAEQPQALVVASRSGQCPLSAPAPCSAASSCLTLTGASARIRTPGPPRPGLRGYRLGLGMLDWVSISPNSFGAGPVGGSPGPPAIVFNHGTGTASAGLRLVTSPAASGVLAGKRHTTRVRLTGMRACTKSGTELRAPLFRYVVLCEV